jgi:2'-5' RNA ligase
MKKKIFIAINLPEKIKSELVSYQEKIDRFFDDTCPIKWTKKDNLHITMFFIGFVEYDSKKNPISQKTTKKTTQSGKTINIPNVISIENKAYIYEQKLILRELNQLTSFVKAINKKMIYLEHKVGNNKKTEK